MTSMVYEFFDKKSASNFTHTGVEINSKNQQLADELHKSSFLTATWLPQVHCCAIIEEIASLT